MVFHNKGIGIMMLDDCWVMYCRKGDSQMEFRRNRALIVGHIGFDYFINEKDLAYNDQLDLETKEDFESYINNHELTPFAGGTAGNVAAVMRRIGALEVDTFSAGDIDGVSKYYDLTEPTADHELDKHICTKDPSVTVPMCLIFTKDEKQTVNIYDKTLCVYDSIQEFNLLSRPYELLHITTTPPNATLKIVEESREKCPGLTISFCPGQNLKLYHPPVLFKILSQVDILFVNDEEMQLLSKMTVEYGEHFNGFPDMIVHTRGSKPTVISTNEGEYHIPTVKPERVVDTTGAGDAYAAAFLSTYITSNDVIEAGQFAAVIASFIVEELGCQTNIPDWKQTYERMKVWENPKIFEGK